MKRPAAAGTGVSKKPAGVAQRPAAASAPPEGVPIATETHPNRPVVDPFALRRELFFECGGLRPKPEYSGDGHWVLFAPGVGPFEKAEPCNLHYFTIRALGQLLQLCFEAAGYPYYHNVSNLKHFKEGLKEALSWGRLPMVQLPDGPMIVQSQACLRCVAKFVGLAGDSDAETAQCDMYNEMLRTEADLKADQLKDLTPELVADCSEVSVKTMSRVNFAELDEAKKMVAAVKFWDEEYQRAQDGWIIGKLSYVDLALFWRLRPVESLLKSSGFEALAALVQKVEQLPGIQRLFTSGRLMPNHAAGYNYEGDDLVPVPEEK